MELINYPQQATNEMFLVWDATMFRLFKQKNGECYYWAEKQLLQSTLPLLLRARALLVLSTINDAFAIGRATEGVRIIHEDVRKECDDDEEFPEDQLNMARKLLVRAERRWTKNTSESAKAPTAMSTEMSGLSGMVADDERSQAASDVEMGEDIGEDQMSVVSSDLDATPKPQAPTRGARSGLPAEWFSPQSMRATPTPSPFQSLSSAAQSPTPKLRLRRPGASVARQAPGEALTLTSTTQKERVTGPSTPVQAPQTDELLTPLSAMRVKDLGEDAVDFVEEVDEDAMDTDDGKK